VIYKSLELTHDILYRWKINFKIISSGINKILHFISSQFCFQVPNTEGRAGMVAIEDPNNALDMKNLASKLGKSLPSYAQPVFIRVLDKCEITATFKIKKTVLQKDGFDPSRIKDKLFFRSGNEYVPLTSQIYQDIVNCRVRIWRVQLRQLIIFRQQSLNTVTATKNSKNNKKNK